MNITVVGIGYVGLANAVLLSQYNQVILLDIVKEKIDLINQKKSPISDDEIKRYLSNKPLNLFATLDKKLAYENADYVVIAAPTNYNVKDQCFDTFAIESVIDDAISINPAASIVIKSTVPIGYTEKIKKQFNKDDIFFSPEFLREGRALYDSLYPSRIIVGGEGEKAGAFADLLIQGAISKDVPVLIMNPTEAEAVKLFSNAYLAMRVSFFNELDSLAESYNLESKQIIEGVCLDPRIGMHYNNPSFGYGGYCLPKDTKQLLTNFNGVPGKLIKAIIESNSARKDFITASIIRKRPKTVGIYRLVMKAKSDNFRFSSINSVIKRLKKNNIEVVIYEPFIKEGSFNALCLISDLEEFKRISDIIVANRFSDELSDVREKVYTRDIYGKD